MSAPFIVFHYTVVGFKLCDILGGGQCIVVLSIPKKTKIQNTDPHCFRAASARVIAVHRRDRCPEDGSLSMGQVYSKEELSELTVVSIVDHSFEYSLGKIAKPTQ